MSLAGVDRPPSVDRDLPGVVAIDPVGVALALHPLVGERASLDLDRPAVPGFLIATQGLRHCVPVGAVERAGEDKADAYSTSWTPFAQLIRCPRKRVKSTSITLA